MRIVKSLVIICIVAFLPSCASIVKFPVSAVVPGAQITAKMKQDRNSNNVIVVTASHMAEASRLTPPSSNYSVWIIADNGMVKNVGQLVSNNARKASLTLTTPFNINEIFITAEERGNLSYPAGVEISRATFNK